MDLNRIKKNIQTRKWESKSMKTNIDYIKKQLKQFGLNTPKYLTTNKKLTQNQIQTQTKRIIREIEKQQDIARQQASIPTMSKAMKNLKKAVNKHNKLVAKQLIWLQKQTNISNERIDYLQGKEIQVNDHRDAGIKYTIELSDSPFKVYNADNLYFDSIDSVNNMIKRIKTKDKQLTHANINKTLKNNNAIVNTLRDVLKGYVDDGNMSENESKLILNEIKKLDGVQQKAFLTTWSNSSPKEKYNISPDEFEEFQYKLRDKWENILKMSRKI